jgi:hypothetical protein
MARKGSVVFGLSGEPTFACGPKSRHFENIDYQRKSAKSAMPTALRGHAEP